MKSYPTKPYLKMISKISTQQCIYSPCSIFSIIDDHPKPPLQNTFKVKFILLREKTAGS